MSRINIFQGNDLITDIIASTLGYETPQKHSWFTQDIYFETYFYITKRFGFPKIVDDYKKISVWYFDVKNYTISIELNSSWVTFMIFGEKKKYKNSTLPISWIKYNREKNRKKHLLIINTDNLENRSEYENKNIQMLLDEFQIEKNIPDDISNDDFNEKWGYEFWYDKVNEFNNKIIGIDHNEIEKAYGRDYSNSNIRHAAKSMQQFLLNMLTPIYIRDAPFNIKGRLSDEDAMKYNRFENNIKIEFKTD